MYRVLPVPTRASSEASLTRCASPPLSVVLCWPSVMYPNPTACKVEVMRWILGMASKKFVGVVDRHGEHVGDAFAAVTNLEAFLG